jgi:putative tricarboxylic transport membrane protein
MDFLHNLTLGFGVAVTPFNLLLAFVGVFLGTVIGVLPGIGPMTGIALLIPVTFGLPPSSAIILMAGIYYGAMYGGSTTSILVNTPGESSSVVTCIDGHLMAKQGRAGSALAAAAIASFVAGTFATLMLMLFGPVIAQVALRFGPPEFFSLMLLGMTVVTSLAGRSMVKALFATLFGLAIAMVGIDLQTAVPRFTFGNIQLLDGLEFIVVAIGLFALTEVLVNLSELKNAGEVKMETIKGGLWLSKEDWKRFWPSSIRGTLSGFFVGGVAGAGAAVASFVSYGIEKRFSKHRKELGGGAIEGVTGPEAANNAAAGGSLIYLLCLGIPGSGTTAIMLGALLMLGLQPGPLLFTTQPAFVWGLIASMYIGNIMLLVLNLPLVGLWVKLLKLPSYLLIPRRIHSEQFDPGPPADDHVRRNRIRDEARGHTGFASDPGYGSWEDDGGAVPPGDDPFRRESHDFRDPPDLPGPPPDRFCFDHESLLEIRPGVAPEDFRKSCSLTLCWCASKSLFTEVAVMDRIIDHLKRTFVAAKPPPSHLFTEVALMVTESAFCRSARPSAV